MLLKVLVQAHLYHLEYRRQPIFIDIRVRRAQCRPALLPITDHHFDPGQQ